MPTEDEEYTAKINVTVTSDKEVRRGIRRKNREGQDLKK